MKKTFRDTLKGNKGFTILELLIVLGIATTMAVMGGLFSTSVVEIVRLRLETSRAVDAFYQARLFARTTGHCVTAEIETHTIIIKSFDQIDCTAPLSGPGVHSLSPVVFPAQIQLISMTSDRVVVFDQFGSLVGTSLRQMKLSDGSRSRMITIFPYTGLVRVGDAMNISFFSELPAKYHVAALPSSEVLR